MSWTIGDVELDHGPSRATLKRPAKVDEFELDESSPILIASGLTVYELVLEGSFVGEKSTIMSEYVFPLMSQVGEVVEIDSPNGTYDTTWLFADFQFVEVNARQVRYTIRLLMGSGYIIDGEEWEEEEE